MKRVKYLHPRSCGHIEFQPWPETAPPSGIAWWIKRQKGEIYRYTWRYVLRPIKERK